MASATTKTYDQDIAKQNKTPVLTLFGESLSKINTTNVHVSFIWRLMTIQTYPGLQAQAHDCSKVLQVLLAHLESLAIALGDPYRVV